MRDININYLRLSAFVLLFVVFSPYIFYEFGFHNDFEIWAYDNKDCCLGFPETSHLITIGRFLQAYLQGIYLSFFTHLNDLSIGRAFGIFVGSVSAVLLIQICIKNGMNKYVSTIFSLLVFLLPPAQINFGWITNFVPGILNSLIVFCAVLIFPNFDKINLKSKYFLLSLIVSSILLLSALFVYPPTAGFFLLPVLIRILFSQKHDSPKLLIKESLYALSFFFVICLTYFIVHKFYIHFYGQKLPETSLYRFDISSNIFSNFVKFSTQIIPVMINLWNPAPNIYFGAIMFMIVGWAVSKKTSLDVFRVNHRFGLLIIISLLFFAANTPGLLASGSPPTFYRSWHPGTAICLLFVIWAITCLENKYIKKVSFMSILTIACAYSLNSSYYLSKILSQQFEYSESQISNQISDDAERFLIIEKRPDNHLLGFKRWGELGFVHVLSRGHGIYILDVNYEIKRHREIDNIVKFYGDDYVLLENKLLNPSEDLFKIIKKNDTQRLIDNRVDTFYESEEANTSLLFETTLPRIVTCYKLFSDINEPMRMPVSWGLYGSSDGSEWTLIDTQSSTKDWGKGEDRVFTLRNTSIFKFYKFKFANKKIIRISEVNFFSMASSCSSNFIDKLEVNPNLLNSFAVKDSQSHSLDLIGLLQTNVLSDKPFRMQRAFDNIYYTFWETLGLFPINADIHFYDRQKIMCYSITSGDDHANKRMPTKWKVFGSNDYKNWTVIDERDNEKYWQNISTRKYNVNHPNYYKNYRISFLKVDGDNFFRIYELGLSPDVDCTIDF